MRRQQTQAQKNRESGTVVPLAIGSLQPVLPSSHSAHRRWPHNWDQR